MRSSLDSLKMALLKKRSFASSDDESLAWKKSKLIPLTPPAPSAHLIPMTSHSMETSSVDLIEVIEAPEVIITLS